MLGNITDTWNKWN